MTKGGPMDESEQLHAARAMRRTILGDAYVDGMTADTDPVAVEFQDYVTSMAWGVWARVGRFRLAIAACWSWR